MASVVPLSVVPSPLGDGDRLARQAGVPVAADFSVTAKLAGSVATGMEGVTVRLVAVAWRPMASVVDAEDAE